MRQYATFIAITVTVLAAPTVALAQSVAEVRIVTSVGEHLRANSRRTVPTPLNRAERPEPEIWVRGGTVCLPMDGTDCSTANADSLQGLFATALGARLEQRDSSDALPPQRIYYRISPVRFLNADSTIASLRVEGTRGYRSAAGMRYAAEVELAEYRLQRADDGTWTVTSRLIIYTSQ